MPRRKRTKLDHDLLYGRWTIFGVWLKQQRDLAGLTQSQAAKAAGISERQWVRYESGRKVLEKRLKRIARIVNVPLENMLDRAGYKVSSKRNAAKDRLGRIYDLLCAGRLELAILQLLRLNDRVAGKRIVTERTAGGPEAYYFAKAIELLDTLPNSRLEVILKALQERIKDSRSN